MGSATFLCALSQAPSYVVIHILSGLVLLGWPTQRNRQLAVMFLKVWVFEVLPDVPRTTQDIETVLDLRTTISNVFTRDIARGFTWEAFLNADATEIMAERAWARQRPGVRARWFGCPEDSSTTSPDVYRDTRDCFLGHLTKEERICSEISGTLATLRLQCESEPCKGTMLNLNMQHKIKRSALCRRPFSTSTPHTPRRGRRNKHNIQRIGVPAHFGGWHLLHDDEALWDLRAS